MDTNIVPNLTEQTMREFFENVVTRFVGLSEQANKVEELSHQIVALNDRISAVENENHYLKQSLDEAREYTRQVESKSGQLESALNDSRAHAEALQNTIVASDDRVVALQRAAEERRATIIDVTNERDVSRNRAADLEVHVSDLQERLKAMTGERDKWQTEADTLRTSHSELKARVDQVNTWLNPAPPPAVEQEWPHAAAV